MPLLLLVVWLVFLYFGVVAPSVDQPRKADAIVVLGAPDLAGALQKGLQLARQGYAPQLLVSAPTTFFDFGLCGTQVGGAQVDCFQPTPPTTRGEAQYVADQAHAQHWKTVLVVTGTYHVARARLLFDRCLSSKVLMIQARRSITWLQWGYEALYETGGWAKALGHRGC